MQACRSSEWAIVAEALMNNAGYDGVVVWAASARREIVAGW